MKSLIVFEMCWMLCGSDFVLAAVTPPPPLRSPAALCAVEVVSLDSYLSADGVLIRGSNNHQYCVCIQLLCQPYISKMKKVKPADVICLLQLHIGALCLASCVL